MPPRKRGQFDLFSAATPIPTCNSRLPLGTLYVRILTRYTHIDCTQTHVRIARGMGGAVVYAVREDDGASLCHSQTGDAPS